MQRREKVKSLHLRLTSYYSCTHIVLLSFGQANIPLFHTEKSNNSTEIFPWQMESYKINPSDKSGRAIALPAPPPPRSLTLGLIEHSHVKTGVIRCQRQFSQLPIFLKQFPCLLEVRQIGISLAISMQKDFASLFWYVMLKERLTCSRCRPGQNSLAQWCSIHVFCYFWLQFSLPLPTQCWRDKFWLRVSDVVRG